MSRNTFVIALALSGLLAGCQTAPVSGPDTGRLARHVEAIRINEALTVPAGYATVRLQAGRTVAMNAVQEFDPYCILELDTVSERPQIVRPGRHEVVAIQKRIQDFSGMPINPMVGMGSPAGGDDGPSQIYYVTEFRLKPGGEPRVRSLRCESNQVSIPSPRQHHLSLADMRQAVGRYIDFVPVR